MDAARRNRSSALMPVAMSGAALAIVIGYAATFGTARQADEGTAAHIWQFLGQLPIVAFVVIKSLPADHRSTLRLLSQQVSAALAAMLPVWWFQS